MSTTSAPVDNTPWANPLAMSGDVARMSRPMTTLPSPPLIPVSSAKATPNARASVASSSSGERPRTSYAFTTAASLGSMVAPPPKPNEVPADDGRDHHGCLLYTSDAADDLTRVDLGG